MKETIESLKQEHDEALKAKSHIPIKISGESTVHYFNEYAIQGDIDAMYDGTTGNL